MSPKSKNLLLAEYKKLLEELWMEEVLKPAWVIGEIHEGIVDKMAVKWIEHKIKKFEEEYPEVMI